MPRKREWKEAELILTFNLDRIVSYKTPLMLEWLDVDLPQFTNAEQDIFDRILHKAVEKIDTWSEEDLKMKFLSFVLELGDMSDEGKLVTFFDKSIKGVVEGVSLSVKSDFMMAKGYLNVYQTPYFHFQEYKPQLNPTGEPMAQLLEAFLIAQEQNLQAGLHLPLYGCEIIGRQWTFITMEEKQYCCSHGYDCTNREELFKIIAILRKFKKTLLEKWL